MSDSIVPINSVLQIIRQFDHGATLDHRINLTLYKLDEVIEGALDNVVGPLIQEHQADQLRGLSEPA